MRARFLTILAILVVGALALASAVQGQPPGWEAGSPALLAQEGSPLAETATPAQGPSAPGAPAPSADPSGGAPAPPTPGAPPAEGASPGTTAPGAAPAEGASPGAPPSTEAGSPQPPSDAPTPGAAVPPPPEEPDYSPSEGIWISDGENGRIVYMLNLQGERFLALGRSGRGPGRFLRPEQIWVDREQRIYVADRGNNRIVRMEDLRGAGYEEMTGFQEPYGVAVHGDRVFVADTGNDRVVVYAAFGGEAELVLTAPVLRHPTYLWVDLDGNLFVSAGEDPPGGRVVRIPASLAVPPEEWEVYEGKGLSGGSFAPSQAILTDHGLFMTDEASSRLVRVDNMAGRDPRQLGDYGYREGEFTRLAGMATDPQGRIYLADAGNDRIVRVDNMSGRGWTQFTSADPHMMLRAPRSVFVWSAQPPKPSPSPSPSKKPSRDDDW